METSPVSRHTPPARMHDKHAPGRPPRAPTTRANRPPKVFSRAYKACVRCRQSKAKCELPPAADDELSQGPCVKCKRERQECEFTATRSTKRPKTSSSNPLDKASSTVGDQSSTNHHSMNNHVAQDESSNPGQFDTDYLPQDAYRSSRSYSTSSRPQIVLDTGQNSIPASLSPRQNPDAQDMTHKLMRTVVTSSNDALGLLFQAVEQHNGDSDRDESTGRPPNNNVISPAPYQHMTPQSVTSIASAAIQPESLSDVEPDVLKLWGRCRFIKQGWFSAREAVTYVDLFFKTCAPLTPILTDYYADHQNHHALVTEEPLLCCTILTISSRIHVLPGMGGPTRSHAIHDRLWHHSEHLVRMKGFHMTNPDYNHVALAQISRIIFGQEKISTAKTRTAGTIESFLLMTEWHPRALHFPPQSDGWDFDLLGGPALSDLPEETSENDDTSALYRWREEVFEPAKRSDRMSWMLIGAAMSLAHELGIFNDDVNSAGSEQSKIRRLRVRMLLYVYINQLATRIGCTTPLSENLSRSALDKSALFHLTESDKHWHAFMTCWIGMTKFLETISDVFFPSAATTRQLLLSGRYKSLLEHFQSTLERHQKELDELQGASDHFRDILFIDYQYIRLYMNSISIQAVVERALPHISDSNTSRNNLLVTNMSPSDYALNAEVIDASCHILRKTVSLANSGFLRYAPVRLYLRIISASIFLLKAMCLGGGNHDLQLSLGVLEECIQALKTTAADSMHLSSRYGTLIERHVARFRKNFVGPFHQNIQSQTSIPQMSRPFYTPHDPQSTRTDRTGLRFGSNNAQMPESLDLSESQTLGHQGTNDIFDYMDDLMVQPFDPSIAPFGMDGQQVMSGFDLRSLDFLWNLST